MAIYHPNRLIRWWRYQKDNFSLKRPKIQKVIRRWCWFTFHMGRGLGQVQVFINLIQYYVVAAVAVEIIPYFHFLKPYVIYLVPFAMLTFIFISQLMDILKVQETETEFSADRTVLPRRR